MKPRLFFLNLGLAAMLLAGCATQAVSTTSPAVAVPTGTALPTLANTAVATVAAEQPLPIATSRGPNLEATDPATVSLASGSLQLVEFFRFT